MGANCSCKDAQGTPVETVVAKAPESASEEPYFPPSPPQSPTEHKTLLETPISPQAKEQHPPLTVEVVGARGLRNADWLPGTGKSDCYCIVKVAGSEQVLHRTRVINDTLEPAWGEEAKCPPGESLEFSVWDKDPVSSNFLGKVVLGSDKFEGGGFNGEVRLEDAGRGIAAYLHVRVRAAGKDYPPGPPKEIKVAVDKVPGKPLGLELDIQDSFSAFVVTVKEGPFQTFNEGRDPEEQLKPGDFIMKVNGMEGKGSKLLDQMKKDNRLELLVRRPQEISVALGRSGSKKLGIDLTGHPIGSALLITKMGAGLVQDSNAKNPSQEIKVGDRVVAVGGRRGTAQELMKLLEAPKICHLTVTRPSSLPTSG